MNPYQKLPNDAFWRTAVADCKPNEIRGMWKPKFHFSRSSKIITAGSCFAQHIGRALRAKGYHWVDSEPAPGSDELKAAYQYGTFSFRTGNIYTARMLNQWIDWALDPTSSPDLTWQGEKGYFDPFRPNIEPGGFASHEEAIASRQATLAAIRNGLKEADVLVFTLGLTECWRDAVTDLEFAVCPGTIAGEYSDKNHKFHNMSYPEILSEMTTAIEKIREINSDLKILLTVSPVPLTATASGQHVLNATSHSKAVLRAVAGELAKTVSDVDYFPSYEIITQPVFGGKFYAENRRSVLPVGVAHVMSCFFDDLQSVATEPKRSPPDEPTQDDRPKDQNDDMDIICEEELLAAFAPSESPRKTQE